MIKFEVKGDLRKAIAAATKSTEVRVEKELSVFALNTVRDAQRKVPVDEGALKNAIAYEIKKDGKGMEVLITAAKFYAPFVEFGTGRFAAEQVAKLPPDWQTYAATFKGSGGPGDFDDFVIKIMAWVKRKGVGATYNVATRRKNRQSKDELQSAAYAIALSIIRNGSPAKPFLWPAYRDNKKKLLDKLGVK